MSSSSQLETPNSAKDGIEAPTDIAKNSDETMNDQEKKEKKESLILLSKYHETTFLI